MTRNTDGRIPVTDKMIDTLQSYKEKTGWGITALFKHAKRENLFKETKSLNAAAVHGWVYKRTFSLLPSDYEKIIKAYETILPDMWHKQHALSRRKERVPISQDFIARLNQSLCNKIQSRTALLKYNNAPKDLSSSKLGLILNCQVETIAKDHLEFLEKLIAGMSASKTKPKRYRNAMRAIHYSHIENMKAEIKRTRTGPEKLIKNARNPPDNLSAGKIYGWLSGRVKRARPEHISWTLRELKSLPSKKKKS